MKYWLALAIMALCHSETYYSYKEYQVAYNLLDTPFTSQHAQIINQEDLLIHLNTFGTIHYPKMLDNQALADDGIDQFINQSVNDPIYFSIRFDQEIIIDDLSLMIDATSNGKALYKSIYINQDVTNENGHTLFSGGTLIYRSRYQNEVQISSGIKVRNIVIRFDNLKVGDIVSLKYFKINQYQILKHSKWVKDKIDNTETTSFEVCLETNDFMPNGTKGYVYDAVSSFSAASQVLSKYQPKVVASSGQTDYLRGDNIYPYSAPNLLTLDNYSHEIAGFSTHGLANTPSMYFTSYGNDHQYIKTGPFSGVLYQAFPIYWTQTKGLNNYVHTSYDSKWCKHTTDDSSTPCFKYQGHTNNQRLNSYDISVIHYSNIVKANDVTFKDVNYYLYDVRNNNLEKLQYSNQLEASFHLNKTGIYQLKAVINDLLDNQIEILSNNFYIDQDGPTIVYTPNKMDWTNQPISVQVNIDDIDSGVKSYINKLNDQVINSKVVTINQEGIHSISTLAYDHVLNSSTNQSLYYKVDFTKPIIEVNESFDDNQLVLDLNIYDQLSGIDYQQYQIYVDDILVQEKRFNQNQLLIDINGKTEIKIMAYDKAGNVNQFEKIYYPANGLDELSMFTKSYQMDQVNSLFIKLKHLKPIQVTMDVLLDDVCIYQETLMVDDEKIIELPYNLNKATGNFKLLIDGQVILAMDVASINFMASDDLIFEGISGYYVDRLQSIEYLEKLILIEDYPQTQYNQAYGIQLAYAMDYVDQCAVFEDFICQPSSELNAFNIQLMIDNGADESYLVGNQYIVDFKRQYNQLLLPDVYVNLKSGDVQRNIADNYIDGHNRYYLSRKLPKGHYQFRVVGQKIGHNQFNFDKLYNYQIVKLLKELYYARFIDPNNVNLKQDSIHSRETIEQLR